jgi:hypothetical protein
MTTLSVISWERNAPHLKNRFVISGMFRQVEDLPRQVRGDQITTQRVIATLVRGQNSGKRPDFGSD